MRATITRADNVVVVDGTPMRVDCSSLSPVIRVVQWLEDKGWIEFEQKEGQPFLPNIAITDFAPYRGLLDRWRLAHAERRVAEKTAELTEAETKIAVREQEEQQKADALRAAEQARLHLEQQQKEKAEVASVVLELKARQAEVQQRLQTALDKIDRLEKAREFSA